ncbi:hypothetical protein [Pseudomonas sp. 1176_21]|uniref:hypothetical protein n=1 Tax=Pseudomonas sp. 1176_21 TaxID=2604453 RepID=UPI0040646EC8
MSEELSVNPIAGWEVKTVEAMQAMLVKFSYVSTPFQRPEEAQKTPLLAISVQQAKELIAVLQKGVDQVESSGISSPPGPKH